MCILVVIGFYSPTALAIWDNANIGPYNVSFDLDTTSEYNIGDPEFVEFSQYDCWAFRILDSEYRFLINMELHDFQNPTSIDADYLKDHLTKSGFLASSMYERVDYQILEIDGNDGILAVADTGDEDVYYFAYSPDEWDSYGQTVVLTECIATWKITNNLLDSLNVEGFNEPKIDLSFDSVIMPPAGGFISSS